MRIRMAAVAAIMAWAASAAAQTGNGTVPLFSGNTYSGPSVITESNGNVGIGTTSPNSNLHLYGSGDQIIEIQSAAGNPGIWYGARAGNYWNQMNNGDGSLYWFNGSAINMYLTQNGYLGIGMSSPSHRLMIRDTATNGVIWSTAVNNPINVAGSSAPGVGIKLSLSTEE